MYLDVKRLVSTGVGNLLDADDGEHFGVNPSPLPDIYTLRWFDKTSGAPASRAEILTEYANVKFSETAHASLSEKERVTRLLVADEGIDELIYRKLTLFEDALRAREPFSGLDDWPADGQLGIFSMAWALGSNFHFPKFQAAATAGDWLTMARECRMTETGNPGVVPRNVRNSLLFTISGWWAAPIPGTFSHLVFRPYEQLATNMRSGYFPIPMNLTIGLQTALDVLGFNPRGLDGVAGENTRKALNEFERSHGLPPTAMVTSIDDVPRQTLDVITFRLDGHDIAHYP
ncbi:peptidoglycan-binding protein [Streptomyces chartreusis]